MVLAGLVALLTLAGFVSSAQAADEVHFDPDSPAGKEYALPVDQAREEVAGGGESNEDSGAGAPLFGAGVSPPGAKSAGSAGPRGDRGAQVGQQANQDTTRSTPGTPAASRAAVVRIAKAGDGYPLASGALLVAVILLLGGVLALGLRGLQRRLPPQAR